MWNAEEFKAPTGGCKADVEEEALATGTSEGGGGGGLCRQGSLRRWRRSGRRSAGAVFERAASRRVVGRGPASRRVAASGWQATLGEITLENFLVKAGVVVRGSLGGHTVRVRRPRRSTWSSQGP
jgi:hypothetical protein